METVMQGFKHLFNYPHSRLYRRISILIPICIISAGCAKIADPLPPEIMLPAPATDLTAHQRAGSVILRASMPQQTTIGKPVTNLLNVEVYRLAENIPNARKTEQIPSDQFQRTAEPILSVPRARLSKFLEQDSIVIEDNFSNVQESLVYNRAFRYALLFVNDHNQSAGFSNQVVIIPISLPRPPETITAEVTEDSILLRWETPEENADGSRPPRIEGYNVYRSTDPEIQPLQPIQPGPLQKPEFRDAHFQFDRTYYYRVSIIGSVRNPSAESLPSKMLKVTPRDTFPPLPVERFNAVLDGESVLLLWYPSPSSDVAGYKIFRVGNDTSTTQPLQEKLITGNSYRDTDIVSGREYTYSITAIDTHGNESAVNIAEITVR